MPLILFFLFGIFVGLYKYLNLPSAEKIVVLTKKYYDVYGLWVVFFGALTEGLLLVNWYVPGSIVVVFEVIFARPDPVKATITVGLIILGFFLTSLLNYGLGKYGWYKIFLKLGLKNPLEKIKYKVENKGLAIIFSTYFHPNLGALTATSAGILNLPFKKILPLRTFCNHCLEQFMGNSSLYFRPMGSKFSYRIRSWRYIAWLDNIFNNQIQKRT